MHNNKKLNTILEKGESIKWSGVAQPYSIFDETHKTSTIIFFCVALVWGIILVGGYVTLAMYKNQEIMKGATIFCIIISLLLAWRPISDKSKVKRLLYAVTDKNAIIISEGNDKACSMRIVDIDELRMEKTSNNNCHIRVGSPTFRTSVRKLPSLAYHGAFDILDDEKTYKGLVFYNVSIQDGETICNLLKPAVAPT